MNNKPKIYDCFLFFNELDLLEIRLNVLKDYVDYFVLVEATKTFTNKDKPLYYKENKERYKEFSKKIIHIVIDEHPPYKAEKNSVGDIWEYDCYQRNQIVRGLEKAKESDVIILSDLDEIINPKIIEPAVEENELVGLQMYVFYYYLNYIRNEREYTPKIFRKKLLETYTPQEIRFQLGKMKVFPNAGWHFSYLGGEEKIKIKLENTAHQQYNTQNTLKSIEEKLNKGIDLYDRDIKMKLVYMEKNFVNYPKYILDNLQKYKHLIKQKQ